ncbi:MULTISPECIES: hypothetical protein [unclassified Rathayibacter]|uniref:hypothetical protein n=1 Tax=unclassified Rathayibacter TaxID=2609250 RepID=UPI00188C529A|nr:MULTISPECIES: hypothetical protein [unclassified Rathayibacter]MBF4463524.1 hypothetical protein [Rathayibacter sp. VKM Ac-2879]MBF4504754.1 hypothetical protein [Rathayibacter sp. VKM Ac-2878]
MTRWSLARRVAATVGSLLVVAVVILVAGPEFTLLGAIGLALVLILVRRPVLGLHLLVLLVPFNGLITQITAGGAIATIYGASKDFLLLGLLLVALVSGRLRRVPRWLVGLVVLMVTVPLIAGVFTPSVAQASYGWRNDYEPLLLLIVVPALLDRRSVGRLLAVFVGAMEVAAATALVTWSIGLQWLLDIQILPVARQEDFPTSLFSSGSLRPRAFSPFVGPNEMAVVMAATLAVIWLLPRLRASHRLLLSALPVAAIMLSESRSGILGMAVVLSVLAAHGIHRRSPLLTGGFIIAAVATVAGGAFLYITNKLGEDGDPSVGGHSLSLEAGIQTMFEHPFGLGLGVVGPRAEQYADSYRVESFLLLLALESGIAVLLIFLFLLVRICRISVKAHGGLGFLPVAVLSATAVSQIVLPTFQEGAVSFLIWLLVGAGLVMIFTSDSAEGAEALATTADTGRIGRGTPSARGGMPRSARVRPPVGAPRRR